MVSMQKGKFIVIEGTDGSGKKTQTDLICKRFEKEGKTVKKIDFPRYGTPSAYFVEKYLAGGYGTSEQVSAKKASLFYALDRLDFGREMNKWIDEGCIVISDRYTTSSMGHQAGKIDNIPKRNEFLDWLSDLEYNICEIPKPDLVIFLSVLPEVSFKLIGERQASKDTKGTKRDIHELDFDHMKKSYEAYLHVAKRFGWEAVDCSPSGKILPLDEISGVVWGKVSSII